MKKSKRKPTTKKKRTPRPSAPKSLPAPAPVRDERQRQLHLTAQRLRTATRDREREQREAQRLRLQAKRRKFVHYFVAGGPGFGPGQGGPSALAAGLSSTDNAARVRAHYLLRDPEVVEWCRRKLEAMEATDERIIEELGKVAFSDARDLHAALQFLREGRSIEDLPDHVAAVVKSYEEAPGEFGVRRHVQLHEKVPALGVLARIRKLLVNRTELTGKDGGPVEVREQVVVYVPDNGRGRVLEVPRTDVRQIQGVSDPADATPHAGGVGRQLDAKALAGDRIVATEAEQHPAPGVGLGGAGQTDDPGGA